MNDMLMLILLSWMIYEVIALNKESEEETSSSVRVEKQIKINPKHERFSKK